MKIAPESNKVRIVFMGSPDFSLPILEVLAKKYQVSGIVTQPDRPAGRGRTITSPPVKRLAEQLNIPCIQPESLNQPGTLEQINSWSPELIVVAAFGQILRSNILDLPKYRCINVHASLLPRWRGAAPIPAAILNGDFQTGITIMLMDSGIDTGAILNQQAIDILADETTGDLTIRLANLGAKLIIDTMPDYLSGSIEPIAQNDEKATYAPMIKKTDALLNFKQPASHLSQIIRAYNPWPVAYTYIQAKRLNILRAIPIQLPNHIQLDPGMTTIIQNKPVIVCDQDGLLLTQVQPAGKQAMNAINYIQGVQSWRDGILTGY